MEAECPSVVFSTVCVWRNWGHSFYHQEFAGFPFETTSHHETPQTSYLLHTTTEPCSSGVTQCQVTLLVKATPKAPKLYYTMCGISCKVWLASYSQHRNPVFSFTSASNPMFCEISWTLASQPAGSFSFVLEAIIINPSFLFCTLQSHF